MKLFKDVTVNWGGIQHKNLINEAQVSKITNYSKKRL